MAAFADAVKACACAKRGEVRVACVYVCVCACQRVRARRERSMAGSGAWQGLRHRRASHLDGQALDGETARGRDNLLELEFVLGRRFALDQRRVVDRAALGLGVEHRELPSEGVG